MKKQKFDRKNARHWLAGASALSLAALMAAQPAFAKAPDAGSSIGMRAYAEFTDSNNEVHNIASNEVITMVQAVYGLDVSAAQKQSVVAGKSVYLSHDITNFGNADDSFQVKMASEADLTGIDKVVAYVDTQGIGRPDAGNQGVVLFENGRATAQALTTPQIKRDAKTHVIVQVFVKAGQKPGQLDANLVALSTKDEALSVAFTDSVQVVDGAAVQVTAKSGLASVLLNQSFDSELEVRNTGDREGVVYLEIPKSADQNFEIDRDKISYNGEKFLAGSTGTIGGKPYVIDNGDKGSVKLAFFVPAGAMGKLNIGMKVVKGQPGDQGNISFNFAKAQVVDGQPMLEVDPTDTTRYSGAVKYEIRRAAAAFAIGDGYSSVIAPGKTAFYTHYLSNLTNEKIISGAISIAANSSQKGMTVRAYVDPNGIFNGMSEGLAQLHQLDLTRPDNNLDLEIDANSRVAVILAVTADNDSKLNGVTDSTVMTVTGLGLALTLTDKTTVAVDSGVQVKKMQQLDAKCDIASPANTNWTQNPIPVKPGECVWYRVTVYNQGKDAVKNVKLRDTVPNHTQLQDTKVLGSDGKITLVKPDGSQKFGVDISEVSNYAEAGMTYRIKVDGAK